MKWIVLSSMIVLSCALPEASASVGSGETAAAEYNMTVRVMPDEHQLDVSGTVLLPAAGSDRPAITFTLSSLMKNLRIDDGNASELIAAKPEDAESKLTHWKLQPKHPFEAGKPIHLRFSYGGGEGIGFTYYIGPEGSFAGQGSYWYPQFEDVRGEGRIVYSVPAGYTVLSTGAKRSGVADETLGRFEFSSSVPTRFAFAAGRYTVLQHDGIVPMRAYLLHPRAHAADYLDGASKVLSILSAEFGPFPYSEFAIAEVPSEPAQKASFSGASMNGFMLANRESLDAPFNLAYYGHEIGHQWWGNLVTLADDSRGAYMLDEAMAQYGSLRVVEAVEGAVAAEGYRRTGYPGYSSSQCGYGYLLSTGLGRDHALGDLPADSWSHELADSKGFLIWDLLARTIGRDTFRQVLRDVTREYAFRSIRWQTFLTAVQKAAGKDLQPFYSQWLERTGAPEFQIEWKQDEQRVRGTVRQTAPFYRQQIEVEWIGVDGEHSTHTLLVDGAATDFVWPVGYRVATAVADPHFYVLHWLPELHGGALARGPALRAFQFTNAGKFDEAEAELRKALSSLPVPDQYGARYWTEYSLAYMLIAKKEWREAQPHLDAALAAPTRDTGTLPFLYWRYGQVAKNLHDDAKLRWAVDGAISADAAAGGKGPAPYMARALLSDQAPAGH